MPRLRTAATVTVRIEAAAVFVVVPAAVSATDVAVSSTASSGSGCASHGPTELVAALWRRSAAAAHRREIRYRLSFAGGAWAPPAAPLAADMTVQTATDDGQTSKLPGLPVTTIRLLHLLSITDRMLLLMSISLSHFDGYKHLAFLPTNAGTLVSCFRLETMGTRRAAARFLLTASW